jgi:hypothetical protein
MLRWVVLALTAVTGFSGLAYEVTWQKYLGILLGAHSEATAAVLGLFLGGLSLGYRVLGGLARALVARAQQQGQPAPLLAVYGAIEASVGCGACSSHGCSPLARAASVALPTGDGALAFSVDVALAALLVVPPAMLMGGTIPFLTQALARNLADATRLHALVYATQHRGRVRGCARDRLLPAALARARGRAARDGARERRPRAQCSHCSVRAGVRSPTSKQTRRRGFPPAPPRSTPRSRCWSDSR